VSPDPHGHRFADTIRPLCRSVGYGPGVKIVVWFAAAGAAVGAVVAMIAHFLSHTLPRTFEMGGVSDSSGRRTATIETPLIHPSWWPVLPVSLLIGLMLGGVIGVVLQSSGLAFVRREAR
jgi:hypothetical protein